MKLLPEIISSGTRIAVNNAPVRLRKGSLSRSPWPTRSATEHLPTVDRKRLRVEKYIALSVIIPLNLLLMYMYSDMSRFLWYLLPISLLRYVVEAIEITSIIVCYLVQRCRTQPKPKVPAVPESFVYLLCCYNETYEELMNSMISLADQNSLDGHNKAIIVVCDGRPSGRGQPGKLMKEAIIKHPSSTLMPSAYLAWDGAPMDVEITKGEFRGLPVLCITKNENRGKRDGIVLVRSFLHKFNQRAEKPSLGLVSPTLFTELANFLEEASIRSVDYAIGIDADTRFDPQCVTKMMQVVREGKQIIGVTANIRVDPKTLGPFSLAYLYQNTEYTIGQHRRRLRQSITSRKVTCLPGCCQLLRVNEKTCGDYILGKFAHHPTATDGLFRTIRSMMSEDRDHICLVLSEFADVQTRVCLSARAYTTAPHSFKVYLSQRRRWTLGPLTSDTLLFSRKSTGWMERLAALTSVLLWLVHPALYVSKIYRVLDPRVDHCLDIIGYYRLAWDFTVLVFTSNSLFEFLQAGLGWFLCSWLVPLLSLVTQMYTIYNLDDFRWGQMRKPAKQREFK